MELLRDAIWQAILSVPQSAWWDVTWFGDSGLLLPAAALIALWLASSRRTWPAAALWIVIFGAASTLAIVEVQDGTARPYHVGDSAILITGQRGRVKVQTVPHSPVGYAVESGMLDAAEAMHHEERHVVSNVVGSDDMRIEIGSALSLSPRDTILLASDGLSDNLLAEEIIDFARKFDGVRYLALRRYGGKLIMPGAIQEGP